MAGVTGWSGVGWVVGWVGKPPARWGATGNMGKASTPGDQKWPRGFREVLGWRVGVRAHSWVVCLRGHCTGQRAEVANRRGCHGEMPQGISDGRF